MPNDQEIFEKVQGCLVEALGVDDDEVTMDASLTTDLGAESIDFLDIVFRLEKSFDIKIPRGELFPDTLLNNPDYVSGGKFTDEGLAALEEKLPHVDMSEFKEDPQVADLPDLFTVGMLVNYVKTKVN